MSASSTPTRAPSAASASARLAAVVDLPTPPLPLATATMFLTPGISLTPRWTACDVVFCETLTLTRATPGSFASASCDQALQEVVLASRRIAELDVDADAVAVDSDLAHRFRRDEIAARVGIGDAVQCLLDVGLGHGHGSPRWSSAHDRRGARRMFILADRPRLPAANEVLLLEFATNLSVSPFKRRLECLLPRPVRCSSRQRFRTRTDRSTSGTSWSTSRRTSGCASSGCRATSSTSSAPTTRMARRSC